MGIGASVFLLALGAILAFAVDDTVRGIDINVVGWIVMAAGAIGLFMATQLFGRRDRVVAAAPVTERVVTEAPVVERVVTETPVVERRIRY